MMRVLKQRILRILMLLLLGLLTVPLSAWEDLGDDSIVAGADYHTPDLAERIDPVLEETTYLYYFESDDVLMSDARTKRYSFGTLPDEKVTLLVYGLDNRVIPRLALYNADGEFIREGTSPVNPYVTGIEFEADDKELFFFEVAAMNDAVGVLRVMLFEGEPFDDDLTLLDTINPLLPGRAFLVAGDHVDAALDGLEVAVEVLPVPRFDDQRPEVFASRGTESSLPPLEERTTPRVQRGWVNSSDVPVYTINVRAAPEPLTSLTGQVAFNKALNLNTFFYFEYHLIIGKGSTPQLLLRGDECQSTPNRPECIQNTTDPNGRTDDPQDNIVPIRDDPAPPLLEEVLPLNNLLDEVTDDFKFIIPDVVVCPFGVFFFMPPVDGTPGDDSIGGTTCSDTIYGLGGRDAIVGGPGFDYLNGGDDNDLLDGGADDDTFIGGAGDDILIDGVDGDFGFYYPDWDYFDGGADVDSIEMTIPASTPFCYYGFFLCYYGAQVNYQGNGNGFIQIIENDIFLFSSTVVENNGFIAIENITTFGTSDDTFSIALDGLDNEFDADGGFDVADYSGNGGNVTFVVDSAAPVEALVTSGTNTDSLINFENYIGTTGVDTVTITNTSGIGLTNYNTGGGADIVTVNNVGNVAVSMNGGADNDIFTVTTDANADTFNGGAGTDTYIVPGNVPINFVYNGITSSIINNDTVLNFENFNLGTGAQTVTVNVVDAVVNNFAGSPGADSLTYTVATDLYVDYNTNGDGSISDVVPGTPPTPGMLRDTFTSMENLTTGSGNDYFSIQYDGINSVLNGGGGNDGADFGASANPLVFELNMAGSAIAYQFASVITDTVTAFETLVGTGGGDTFLISDASGFTSGVQGSGGDDNFQVTFNAADAYNANFDGGTGTNDTLNYALSTGAAGYNITVDAAGNGTVNRGVGIDTISGFETYTATNLNDTFNITADTLVSTYNGMGGAADTLSIQGGVPTDSVDIVYNGGGAATATVNGVTDTITGVEIYRTGNGDDSFTVTALDAVTFDGGGNNDTLAFNMAVDQALTVNYAGSGAGTVVGTNTVTFENMEVITTEDLPDTFLVAADAVANTFNAGGNIGGSDLLSYTSPIAITLNYTGGGNGTVTGGATDTFTNFESFASSNGNDIYNVLYEVATGDLNFNGGSGTDILDYGTTPAVVGLRFNIGVGGHTWVDDDDSLASADNHFFTNFEIVRGGAGADQIRINDATGFTQFDGGGGNDTYNVNDTTTAFGTIGNPGLLGGAGNDLFMIDWDNNADFFDGGTNTSVTGDAFRVTEAAGGASPVAIAMEVNYTGGGSATITDGTTTDTLTNFETIRTGTADDDYNVAWDTTSNRFEAEAGNDTYTLTTNNNVTVNVGTGDDTVTDGFATDTLVNFESITTAGGDDIFTINTNSNENFTINAGGSLTGNRFNFTGAGTGTALIDIYTSSGALDWLDFSAVAVVGVTIDMSNTTSAQTIFGGFQIFLHNAIENLEGTNQIDNITGTDNANQINGNGGADVIDAGAGSDTVNGGAGGDTLYGGLGNDTVNGDAGNDTMYGGVACGGTVAPSAAILAVPAGSTDGSDTVNSGAGTDTVYGGNNNSAETNAGDCNDSGDASVSGGADGDNVFGGNNNTAGGTGADGGDFINTDDPVNDNDTVYGDNAGGAGGLGPDAASTDPGELDGLDNGP